jgi:hypothetical protein
MEEYNYVGRGEYNKEVPAYELAHYRLTGDHHNTVEFR